MPALLNIYPSRNTGWQFVYGLRSDMFGLGYESQYTIGCLDAPTSMAGGSVEGVTDYRASGIRFISETPFFRQES